MVQKAEIQEFTQSWNKTVNWAKQNKIPYSAYYPVYQMDTQRMLSGSQMSESERVRAIEASAGLNYSTALPTDNQDWLNVPSNAVTNAQDIFTGLEPTHIIPNVFDTVKSTFTHPGNILGAIGDLVTGNAGAASRKILQPNNILQWVPGVYDLARIDTANANMSAGQNIRSGAGLESLAKDPITSLLDVIPLGRAASETIGRTAIGDSIAERLGVTNEEVRQAGIWRVGGRLIKTAPVPSILSKVDHPLIEYAMNPETGTRDVVGIKDQPTIGERWELWKQKVGASSEQADIIENRLKTNDEGTRAVEQYVKPALNALSKLTPDQREFLTRWSQTDFRSLEEKMSDSRVPIEIREAYEATWQWSQQHEQIQMQADKAVQIRTPWKDDAGKPITELYHVNTDQYRAVKRALDQSETDQKALDEAAKPFDTILYKMDENDRNMQGVFAVLDQQRTAVNESIKRSIPQESDATVTDRLRSTLPQGERWDRAVAEQTPLIRNLLGILPSDRLTLHQVNALRDLFSDGGLLDQANEAYRTQDWVKLNKVTKAAVRKFKTQAMKDIPKQGRAVLYKISQITDNLQKYAAERQRQAEELNKLATGYYRGSRGSKAMYQKSLAYLSVKAAKSHQNFLKVAIHNPPDVWRNAGMDAITTKLTQAEKTAAAMEDTHSVLSAQGWTDSELTKIRQDPRTMMELMTNSAKGSLENNMLPDIDHEEYMRVQEDMFSELASLRARGQVPLYVHNLSTYDVDEGLSPDYNVFIRGVKPRRASASFSKTWGYTPTIYDIGAGMLKATKDMVESDMLEKFISQELMPRLYDAGDMQSIIRNYYSTEIANLAEQSAREGAPRTETALSVIDRGLKKFNLVAFDPKDMFGEGFSHPALNKPYYINADLARTFKGTIDKFQFPAQNIVDRGTNLFRFSILGLSPRYTAHILFGGTFLVALRAHPGMLKFIGNAVHFGIHNSFDDNTLKRFPDAPELIGTHSTQEGAAMAQYHYATMNSAGRNWLIPEWMSRHGLDDTYKNRIQAALDINMRFTRGITRAQKALVYLDAAARAQRDGTMYYADELVPRTDAEGNAVTHPVTGRQMYDTVRSKVPMTAKEAHKEGMDAVTEVMGNLRHMTPLERSLLTRVFPFYGWTKHILQYVMSYPFDHPYRAMILGNIAQQDSEDTASGLPLRIQLLTFVGQPDEYGNVTAIDTKALDPLRDTANYASLTGLFESLNPAITAFGGLVDPQFSYGGQNMYPNVTFSNLYGTKTSSAGGGLFTAAEQFVPQLTALDAAFNLSGQYAYLAQDPQSFDKKVFESLGLPFTPEQLNLRQIAAQQELDRYNIASTTAYDVATGQPDAAAPISAYPAGAELPDPLNTEYNVTPAYLEAMEAESEKEFNLPYYETATPPTSPAI